MDFEFFIKKNKKVFRPVGRPIFCKIVTKLFCKKLHAVSMVELTFSIKVLGILMGKVTRSDTNPGKNSYGQ